VTLRDSDLLELRRTLLRVLQKDFHALSRGQFEQWAQQILAHLDGLTHEVSLLTARVAELEQQLGQRTSPPDGAAAISLEGRAAHDETTGGLWMTPG
jgi:hypothetical protein